MKKRYVAYFRVSTREQGDSTLGLKAQERAVRHFTKDGELISEFTEIESGRNCERTILAQAIYEAKKNKAKLVIAKLDRLARDVAFIYTLRNSGVDFICADMPDANSLTIGIMAVLAEDEAKRISERTKSALAEIKDKVARGEKHVSKKGNVVTKLGTNNLSKDSIAKSVAVRAEKANTNPDNIKAGKLIISLHEAGKKFGEIARELNSSGFKTSRGNNFSHSQTQKLYERFKA